MLSEPRVKRTYAFIDGQNLFFSAKEAFGYTFPNYDVFNLSQEICSRQNWRLDEVYYYTGVPSVLDNKQWAEIWSKKLAIMGSRGVHVFRRELRYRNKLIKLEDGTAKFVILGQEKGIDVRIALDVVRFTWDRLFDVALIFSQDQDFSEVADEVRRLARFQSRWIKIASAFPFSSSSVNKIGINKTDWIRIDKPTYDACLDPVDYRV